MTLFELSFPFQHHKACASRMINALNESQICYSCIQPCFFAHECNPHDTNVTQHVPHVRHKIASTNLLHCIQEAHKLHTISLEASNPVSLNTSFFLQAEGQDVSNTGDLSPIRQQHGKHHSSDNSKTTCSSDSDMSNTGDLSPIRRQHGKHHSSDDNETTCSSESVSNTDRRF